MLNLDDNKIDIRGAEHLINELQENKVVPTSFFSSLYSCF